MSRFNRLIPELANFLAGFVTSAHSRLALVKQMSHDGLAPCILVTGILYTIRHRAWRLHDAYCKRRT
jgi:hypothetical protein